MKPTYFGFNSFEYESSKTFVLTDIELVKSDLLNHIFTRRGERVMMPTFGTLIPDLIFEPLDEETIETLNSELVEVFEFDPRVELLDMQLTPDYDNNSIQVSASLFYIELNVQQGMDFNIIFESFNP